MRKRLFERLVTELFQTSHLPEMQSMARRILGADSFGLGVCYGLVSYPAHEISGLLELGQVFLLAELHDQVCRPLSVSSFAGPKAGTALFIRGLFAFGEAEWLQSRLAKAHAKRELIYNELKSIVEHPADFFEGLPGKVQQAYQAKWHRFTQLHQAQDLRSQFEAGKIFGELLMEVLVTIASLVAMAGALVKLGAKAPQLLKVARGLKSSPPATPATGRLPAPSSVKPAESRGLESRASGARASSATTAEPKPEPRAATPEATPPTLTKGSGHKMIGEALGHLKKLPPDQRVAAFEDFATQITTATNGQWSAKPFNAANARVYAGEGGEALVFDDAGNMYRGNLGEPGVLKMGESAKIEMNFEALKQL